MTLRLGAGGAPSLSQQAIPDEQRLMEDLGVLHRYDPNARPVFNASHNITVKFGLTFTQIYDVNEVDQVLTTNVWLEQGWTDERLIWNPADYSGLHTLRIPCHLIWLPDIVLYNNADDYTNEYMPSRAMVQFDGHVFWPPPAKFRSSCKIDITYFPFDDQVCMMKFGSWTYDGHQVDLVNRSSHVELDNYVNNGEWELIDILIERNEEMYQCCPQPYPDVTFKIIIRRRILYYMFNVIFPCLWLTVLCLIGFWLPPDCGEKVTLGITVLLAFSVFMLLVAQSVPATSEYVPLIGVYITVTMGMTSLSIILTVIVLHIHHVGPFSQPPPAWVRFLVLRVIVTILCKRKYVANYMTSNKIDFGQRLWSHGANKRMWYDSTAASCGVGSHANIPRAFNPIYFSRESLNVVDCDDSGRASPKGTKFNSTYATSTTPPPAQPESLVSPAQGQQPASHPGPYSPTKRALPSQGPPSPPSTSSSPPHLEQLASELDSLIARQSDEDAFRKIVREWRLVAYLVDRLLFWVFFIVALVCTIVILVIRPLTKPDKSVEHSHKTV